MKSLKLYHLWLIKVRNIQRRKVELNITLPKVNSFDTKQKMTWNSCFIVYLKHQTRSGWMLTRHRIFQWQQNCLFFRKRNLLEQLFWIIWFWLTLSPFFVKSLSHYKLLVNQYSSNLFHLCDVIPCNIMNYLIRCRSKRCIIMFNIFMQHTTFRKHYKQ